MGVTYPACLISGRNVMVQTNNKVMTVEEKAAFLDRLLEPGGDLTLLSGAVSALQSSADDTGCEDGLTVVDGTKIAQVAGFVSALKEILGMRSLGEGRKMRFYRAQMEVDGQLLFGEEIEAPMDATVIEKDAAFMAKIAQRASVRYDFVEESRGGRLTLRVPDVLSFGAVGWKKRLIQLGHGHVVLLVSENDEALTWRVELDGEALEFTQPKTWFQVMPIDIDQPSTKQRCIAKALAKVGVLEIVNDVSV